MSLVLGLGLEHSCPWPREVLSSERLSLALALASSLVSLTPPLVSGIFQQNFNGSKIVLSSSRGQANFRGLEASRPRTSKCVLEDVFEAKDVSEDFTSGVDYASVNGSITLYKNRFFVFSILCMS